MKKTNFTIGQKLAGGSILLLAGVAALAFSSLFSIRQLGNEFDLATKVNGAKLQLANDMAIAASDLVSCERGMLVHGRMNDFQTAQKYFNSAKEQGAKMNADMDALRATMSFDQGLRDLDALSTSVNQMGATIDEAWQLERKRKFADAERVQATKGLAPSKEITARVEDLVAIEKKLIAEGVESGRASIARDRWMTALLVTLSALSGAALLWLTFRSTRELREIADHLTEGKQHVAGASSQVAASSQALAQGSSEQAASLEQTSASVEEITSMVKKNAENSRSVAGLMGDTEQLVKDGNRTLEQMVISMHEINSSSDKIGKIIKVIDEIAFQTNILALNAAVEAARAGEAGMGFAVVAGEVRNLAQRSAQAAKDTAALIEESISKSTEGSNKLQQVTDVIRAITDSSTKVKTLVDEVNLGSQEQARGIDEISKAIQHMNQLTQSTAASAEEGASASEELSAQAATMGEAVERLRAMVERQAAATPAIKRAAPGKRLPEKSTAKRELPALAKSKRSAIPLEEEFTEI